jgi:hypothetical protein
LGQEVELLKQKQILNKLVFYILTFCFASAGLSQELYDHQLNEEKWTNIRDNIRYESKEQSEWTYENYEEYLKAQKGKQGKNRQGGNGKGEKSDNGVEDVMTPEKRNQPPPSSPNINPGVLSLGPLGWIFLIIIIAGVVALIIYLIATSSSNPANVKVRPVDYLDDIPPAEIPLTELQRLLKEALDKNDYRAAVRIYYLFILRDISKKKWIKWEREKTNMHYLREMSGRPEYYDFDKTVGYFEIVWYGKRDVTGEQFTLIKPDFTNLLDKLGVE